MGGQEESCEHGSYQCPKCLPYLYGNKAKAVTLPLPKGGDGLPIAFDFDGVLADGTWPSPKVGAPIGAGISALLEYRRLGYEIVIFTARPESHGGRIRAFLIEQGLNDEVYDIRYNKPRYALLVDDRARQFPEAFEGGPYKCACGCGRSQW